VTLPPTSPQRQHSAEGRLAHAHRAEGHHTLATEPEQTPQELSASPAVVVDGVTKTYQRGRIETAALIDVSLTVASGEFVAVTGPSGSGKSTLLHLIAGLDRPSSGRIHVSGHCVSAMSDDDATEFRRRQIGVIYQTFRLLPDLTIEENVGVPLMLDGRPAREIEDRVTRALEQLGLHKRRQHMPTEISGGELQRAAIARALVMEPTVLLADEPTGNLDSYAGERVLLDMRRAVDELGRTVILITHDAKAAAQADRIERLLDGAIVPRSRPIR
jgi:putative ABC transport system ATP-binding protein